MEIQWLWGNTIFLSFVLLAPPSHTNNSPLRDGHDEIQIKECFFLKESPVPKAWGIPGAAMTWMCSFLLFQTLSGSPAEQISFSRDLREDQSLGFMGRPEWWKSLTLCHTWARHMLLQLQGYFIRVTEQNWRFFSLMPLLVTMELRAARPRQAPRNIITGKTLQGLLRKIIQPTQNAKSNLKFAATSVAWIWSDHWWGRKRGKKLVVSWVLLKLGTHVHPRLNIKHPTAF